MNRIKLQAIYQTLLTFFAGLSAPASAQPTPINLPPSQSGGITSMELPTRIIDVILPSIIFILGFIAIYYMVLASIRLIISRGEPEKVAEARSRLIYAVVGFVLLILSYAILQFVDQVFLKTRIAN